MIEAPKKKIAENNNKVRMYKEKKPGIRVFVGSFGDGIINCRLRAVKKIGRKMRSVYSNSGSSCMQKHHTHHEWDEAWMLLFALLLLLL